ncbi:MAG: hypothetical protein KC635_06425, partial [Myxococcales bacterium]|nr:hypothetical protein [Myxococcales bacterium]
GGGGGSTAALRITGIMDGPLTGGVPKAIEFYVGADIDDLGIYGFGSANNGGGTDGQEFTFPSSSVPAGTYLYLATETTGFQTYFGFAPGYTDNSASVNGDDAIELFENGVVIDTFGEISGGNAGWDYLDGWAYRKDDTGPGAFVADEWTFSGANATDNCTTNATCSSVFPIGTFEAGGGGNPCGDGTCVDGGNGVDYTCTCPAGEYDDGATCTACDGVTGCVGAITCTTAGDSACDACAAGSYTPECAACEPIASCDAVTCTGPDDETCVTCADGYEDDGAGGCALPSGPDTYARVAFAINDASHGSELVVTDCTVDGTHLVDIAPGGASSDAEQLTPFGRAVYFSADDGTNGRKLWRASPDGTAELVEDQADDPVRMPKVSYTTHRRIAVFADAVYFSGVDDTHGTGLFATDGAAAIAFVGAFGAGGVPDFLTPTPSRLYFSVFGLPSGDHELWWVDADGNANRLPLPSPNTNVQDLSRLIALGDAIFFQARDVNGTYRYYFVPPGATEATELPITPNVLTSTEPYAVPDLGQVFFSADHAPTQYGLAWADADGGSGLIPPTGRVVDASPGFTYEPQSATLFYNVGGGHMHRTDGTSAGVEITGFTAFTPQAFEGLVYFIDAWNNPKVVTSYDPVTGATTPILDLAALNTGGYELLPQPAAHRLVVQVYGGVSCIDVTDPSAPTATTIVGEDVTGSAWTGGNNNGEHVHKITSF